MIGTTKLGTTTQPEPGAVDLSATVPLLMRWRAAVAARETAERVEAELKEQYKSTLRALNAETGYLLDANGVRRSVVTCKATSSFQGTAFRKARPDLVEQFEHLKEVKVLDTNALKKQFPEVYKAFQTVAIRPDWKAVDDLTNQNTAADK